MKPPDPSSAAALCCAIAVLFVSARASDPKLPTDEVQVLPPPPLLNLNAAASSFARLDPDVPKSGVLLAEVSTASSITAAEANGTEFSFEDASNATTNGTRSQLNAENVSQPEDVVIKTSVQGTVKELTANGSEVVIDEQQPVTRTSLRVSEVELGANGEVVSAVSDANLQDAVTQTSVKFTQQEVLNQPTNESEKDSQAPKPDVENIQEILKQIQNEVGEARILYVADPKAKKGVRIGHQTEAPPEDSEYNDDDDDVEYEDYEAQSTKPPLSIVQLKKLSLPRNRPTITRQRAGSPSADDQSDHNVIGMKQKQKFTRPAFGILQRPKKTTVAPGPRTVRPFVKVFDRAKARPKTKTVQQIRIRKPGQRITTAKPVRKGFPIGPPKSAIPSDASVPSGPSLADFEEIYRRQKAQKGLTETSTYRTVDEDVPDDFGEPDSQVPLVYYEGQTKISDGWEWSPYLDDRNTKEFKYLAFHVKHQLKSFLDETRYGEFLNYILIDGFTKELTVDFFLVFYKTEPMINDTELTDEIREVMAYKTEENDFEFTLNSNSTIFRFKFVKSPATERLVEAPLLPNWAIAMLVFGFGSLILIAGSVIMANNFRSIRKLKNIKKRKQQEKQLQLQMSNMPHRYPEVKKPNGRTSETKSSTSETSSRGYAGSAGTLDKRPPMLERYQRDYGTYEQKNPLQEELYAEYETRARSNDKSKRRETRPPEIPADRYSTIGSHFPSSYKSLLQPSKSILYRPPK